MGFDSFVGLLPAVAARDPSFLCPLVFAFPHAAFRPWSLWSFSAILSPLCLSQFSMVFVPVFPNPTLMAALRFDTPPVLSMLRVFLGNPSVVWVLLPCIFAGYLSYSDHSLLRVFPCPSGCLSPLRDCFSACLLWCSSLRLWFFLHWVCLALLLWLQVVSFSDSFESLVPVATWSTFGTSPVSFGLCFLGSSCLPLLISFLFVSTPFLCLVSSWRSLRVVFTRWLQLFFFSLVLSLLRCWFFHRPFLVPTHVGSFHPSSSSYFCLLRSSVPFASGPLVRPGSWFFPIFLVFMFLRFCPLPSSLVGLVPLFLLPAIVSFLLHSFWAVSIFSFFSALPLVLCPLFSSSGFSLGLLYPALGSGRCVLLWVSLLRLAVWLSSGLFLRRFSSSACSCF